MLHGITTPKHYNHSSSLCLNTLSPRVTPPGYLVQTPMSISHKHPFTIEQLQVTLDLFQAPCQPTALPYFGPLLPRQSTVLWSTSTQTVYRTLVHFYPDSLTCLWVIQSLTNANHYVIISTIITSAFLLRNQYHSNYFTQYTGIYVHTNNQITTIIFPKITLQNSPVTVSHQLCQLNPLLNSISQYFKTLHYFYRFCQNLCHNITFLPFWLSVSLTAYQKIPKCHDLRQIRSYP